MTIKRLRGKSRLMFFRLCVRAPRILISRRSSIGERYLRGGANLLIYANSYANTTARTNPCSAIPLHIGVDLMLSPTHDSMTSSERRSGVWLASIFALRMLGLFLILPVFSIYAKELPSGNDMALVGLALGAYRSEERRVG